MRRPAILSHPAQSRFSSGPPFRGTSSRPCRFYFEGRELTIESGRADTIYAQFACRCGFLVVSADLNGFIDDVGIYLWFIRRDLVYSECIGIWTRWTGNFATPTNPATGFVDLVEREVESILPTGEDELTIRFRTKAGLVVAQVFDPPERFLSSSLGVLYHGPHLWQKRHLRVVGD